jgi:hypothetical protein
VDQPASLKLPRRLYRAAQRPARAQHTSVNGLVRRLLLSHIAESERAQARAMSLAGGMARGLEPLPKWGVLSKRQVAKRKGQPWAQPKQLPLEVLSDERATDISCPRKARKETNIPSRE